MILKFKDYLRQVETNVPGGMGDYATGAYMSSDQTGTETGNDDRGMLPSTDLKLVPTTTLTGRIAQIKFKENPIKMLILDPEKKTHQLYFSRDEFGRIQGDRPAAGKTVTVIYQHDPTDKARRIAQIDKITVH
jgi:hypothetical protein